jgi:hypothetical protein
MAISESQELRDFSCIYNTAPPAGVEQGAIYRDINFPFCEIPMRGVVLTPKCDIIQDKTKMVTLALVQNARMTFAEMAIVKGLDEAEATGQSPISKTKSRPIIDSLGALVDNRHLRWHFLPEAPGLMPHLCVDFQVVFTVPLNTLDDSSKLVTLCSPWREQLYARYAAYCGRIGVPQLSNELKQVVIDGISTLAIK